jgi:hypothetical protein
MKVFKMRNYICYLLLFLIILLIACEEESTPTEIGTDPIIEEINIRAKWNSASPMLNRVEVKVADPQGISDISGVFMEVKNQSNNQVVFSDSLYDDGAFFNTQDGDVIAEDGFFSNQFSSVQILSGAGDGDYEFTFQAFDKDNHPSNLAEQTAIFGPDARPEIINVSAPDTLFSGTPGQIFEVAVFDSDGIDDVIRVYYENRDSSNNVIDVWDLFNDGNFSNHGDLFPYDSIYSIKLDSSFAVDKRGLYRFSFYVEDSFNEKNLYIPIHPIIVENKAGRILYKNIPDSIKVPATNYNRKLMTVKVTDPQSLLDIESVYLYSIKPSGKLANNGNPIYLVDNGLPFDILNYPVETGDEIPNDGLYSLSLVAFPGDTLGIYKFSFYIEDLIGNVSEVVKDSVILY